MVGAFSRLQLRENRTLVPRVIQNTHIVSPYKTLLYFLKVSLRAAADKTGTQHGVSSGNSSELLFTRETTEQKGILILCFDTCWGDARGSPAAARALRSAAGEFCRGKAGGSFPASCAGTQSVFFSLRRYPEQRCMPAGMRSMPVGLPDSPSRSIGLWRLTEAASAPRRLRGPGPSPGRTRIPGGVRLRSG